jgi:hypothetical protein
MRTTLAGEADRAVSASRSTSATRTDYVDRSSEGIAVSDRRPFREREPDGRSRGAEGVSWQSAWSVDRDRPHSFGRGCRIRFCVTWDRRVRRGLGGSQAAYLAVGRVPPDSHVPSQQVGGTTPHLASPHGGCIGVVELGVTGALIGFGGPNANVVTGVPVNRPCETRGPHSRCSRDAPSRLKAHASHHTNRMSAASSRPVAPQSPSDGEFDADLLLCRVSLVQR